MSDPRSDDKIEIAIELKTNYLNNFREMVKEKKRKIVTFIQNWHNPIGTKNSPYIGDCVKESKAVKDTMDHAIDSRVATSA